MVKKESLKIIRNDEVADKWFVMELSITDEVTPLPGQFISISFPDIFFRRPFAISGYKRNKSISILYQVQEHYIPLHYEKSRVHQKYNATTYMAGLSKGDWLDCMYYHGNIFPYHHESVGRPILVAGGIGLGPLLYFSQWLMKEHNIISHLIIGARTSSHIPQELLKEYQADITIVTDDGTLGSKESSIDALSQTFVQNGNTHKKPTVYLCGPLGMMRAGAELCKSHNIDSWVSLDSTMACAMGACVGCVVPVISEERGGNTFVWKKACTQGPVFNSRHIMWEQL